MGKTLHYAKLLIIRGNALIYMYIITHIPIYKWCCNIVFNYYNTNMKDKKSILKEIYYGRTDVQEYLQYCTKYNIPKNILYSKVCRYCKQHIEEKDFTTYTTYWYSFIAPCHIWCLDQLTKEESYECQNIDQSCNDCIFFKRQQGVKWHCAKLDIPTTAQQNICNGNKCQSQYFIHRKDNAK